MRSKAVAAFLQSIIASRLFCLGIAITLTLTTITGCGGSAGSTGGGTTTTVTSVTVACTPTTLTAGQSSTCTATVQGQDNPSQAVAWSVSPASAGTISTAGVLASSSSITASTTATIMAASTVPGYTNITGTATVTIDPVSPPQPTVTISASPSTITVGNSTVLTWSSTNATSCTASGGWSGAQATSGTATESPSATTTYGIACTGAGGSATASATVTVNAAPLPNVASISPNVIFADWSELLIAGIALNGNGFADTDTVYPTGFNNLHSASYVSPTQFSLELQFGTTGDSPGWLTFALCESANDTNCGTSQSIAFLGAQEYLAIQPSGNSYFLDQAQANVQEGLVHFYNPQGSLTNSCQVGVGKHSIAVDTTTPYMLVDGQIYNTAGQNYNGSCDYLDTPVIPSSVPQLSITAVAAYNGYAMLVQSGNNTVWSYDMTGGTNSKPTAYFSTPKGCTTPWAIAPGTFGTETDGFVACADGTPSLVMMRASDAYTGEEPALPLAGVTPLSTVAAANLYAGGLYVVAFDSGPASGTIAVLSTYDQLLLLIDKSSWTITKSIKLSGTPFRIDADKPNGRVLVAFANPASVTTTYAWVDASSGTVTPLATTSSLLSVGLGFDGTNVISAQRNQIDLEVAK